MPKPLLLLRLEAPMQSWGLRARWDVRDTGPEPTKSGVIGLLGCALGLSRNDARLAELDRALLFAVRADRPGVLSTDYHTVTGRHRMASGKLKGDDYTVQSYREYLHDAAFLVALEGPEALLMELEGALMHPHWPLYLGRKSCVPVRPVLERLAREYAAAEEAMHVEPWATPFDIRSRRFTGENLPRLQAWVEAPEGERERQDVPLRDPLRLYGFRRCKSVTVDAGELPWSIV